MAQDTKIEPDQMQRYHDLVRLLIEAPKRGDRTGTGTRSLFAESLSFDCQDKVPFLTTKRLFIRGVFEELLWFISGSTDVRELQAKKVHIWSEWQKEDGSMGPGYSHQWRHFGATWRGVDFDYTGQGVDQLTQVIEQIKTNPYSRRHIVSAWNPVDLPEMGLPPCHMMFQFYVRDLSRVQILRDIAEFAQEHPESAKLFENTDSNAGELDPADVAETLGLPTRELDIMMVQRSADVFLGVPFNIASYATLLHMVARLVGMTPGKLHMRFGDVHLYENHVDQAKTMLERDHLPGPLLHVAHGATRIEDFTIDDLRVEGYKHQGAIKAPIAV